MRIIELEFNETIYSQRDVLVLAEEILDEFQRHRGKHFGVVVKSNNEVRVQ